MKIEEIYIDNYKSLIDFKLKSPNAFSVFVGANASGKSNIFEAIEFLDLCTIMSPINVHKSFGNINDLINKKITENDASITLMLDSENAGPTFKLFLEKDKNYEYILRDVGIGVDMRRKKANPNKITSNEEILNFSRIFIGNNRLLKRNIQDDSKLALDASNLEKVLKRLLKGETVKAEIIEWLQLLIPGFEKIEIVNEPLSGSDNLLIYEKGTSKPFNKHLISDGTYNILSILAAVYQSNEPQFLCIEEPENGLNPKVIKELVNLFRQKCEEGHFIWLNTHSQTLVSELTPEEIIIIDKKDGITVPKQIKGMNLHGLKMDEALLTNALGGGIPW